MSQTGHTSHHDHHQHGNEKQAAPVAPPGTAIDPVCGMTVADG